MNHLCLVLLGVTLAAPLSAQTLLQLPMTAPVRGELSTADPEYSAGDYYDEYIFLGEAGAMVTVEASSAAIDTFLDLYSLDMEFALENDDIIDGENLNSRIQTVLPITGTYFVEVSAYDLYELGPYTLTISYVPPTASASPSAQQAGSSAPTPGQTGLGCPAGTVFQDGACVWQPPTPAVVCPGGMEWNGATCVATSVVERPPAPSPSTTPPAAAPETDNTCIATCSQRYRSCNRDSDRSHGACLAAVTVSGVGDAINRQPGAWNEATDRGQGCLQAKTEADRFCREERMACEARCP